MTRRVYDISPGDISPGGISPGVFSPDDISPGAFFCYSAMAKSSVTRVKKY